MSGSKVVTDPVANKTCIIVGTRPGIIKMSPLIEEFDRRSFPSFVIHAGQHYSDNLDADIFDDLGLEYPSHHLSEVKNKTYHGEQTAAMLAGIESILLDERPETVLVCGDANFNLAGALAASKLNVNLGHVEAGLRSDDWRMPEEKNRVMIDHISDYLFVPTEQAKENAVEDNVHGEIHVTGNTIVDAVHRNIARARERSQVLAEIAVKGDEYVVFTAHREENVDDREVLEKFVTVLERITGEWGVPIVYPIHPRTEDRLSKFGLQSRVEDIELLRLIPPLGYLDFLQLLDEATVVLTDSGGIQEESCILEVPCVTLRRSTERPETVDVGANTISGTDPDTIVSMAQEMRGADGDWENPFGDGNASKRIADIVLDD